MARVTTSVLGLLVVFVTADAALGQETMSWPTYPLNGHDIQRGPGFYFAWWKLLLIWLLFLAWVKSADWVNRDSQLLSLNHLFWNPIQVLPFLGILVAITLTLVFPIGFTLAVVAWLAPLVAYIVHRNANVEEFQKILTPDHIRHLLSGATGVDTSRKAAHEKGAPVDLMGTSGGTTAKNEANMILARQSEGYVGVKDLLADAIDRRGTKIMLDTDAEQVGVRYQIDGVWHEADPMEREIGDPVVEVLKRISNADPEQRRKRQSGEFSIKYNSNKSRGVLVSQGTKTGERTIVSVVKDGLAFDDLETAGMRDKLRERLKSMLATPSGILVFSSVPSGGLSTTVALAGKMADRYMRDFTSFQDINKPEPVAENISIETFDGKKEAVVEKLQTVVRKDPDVIIVHELESKELGELICNTATDDKLLITTMRAKEAVEALLRVLLLKIPAKSFAPLAVGVVNQRLIRKLCEECKEEYEPSPALLKKLGLPADRVDKLYQPPTPDEDEKLCTACGGLGYIGRTSIFEVLTVDDRIREALVKQPKLEVLRKVAKKGGHRSLQEEGILLVVQGITSLAELSRVMKQ